MVDLLTLEMGYFKKCCLEQDYGRGEEKNNEMNEWIKWINCLCEFGNL